MGDTGYKYWKESKGIRAWTLGKPAEMNHIYLSEEAGTLTTSLWPSLENIRRLWDKKNKNIAKGINANTFYFITALIYFLDLHKAAKQHL